MLNPNLKPELSKLPIQDRLQLMMYYRVCEVIGQKSPLSESEYWAIDKSIKSGEEIRAYNRANRAFLGLLYLSNNIQKLYLALSLEFEKLQKISLIKYQTESIIDGINFFLHCLDDIKKPSEKQKTDIVEKLKYCLNSNGVLFHKFDIRQAETEEGKIAQFIEPKINPKINDKNDVKNYVNKCITNFAKYKNAIDEFIEEYSKIENENRLFLKPLKELVAEVKKDISDKQKTLDSKYFLSGFGVI